MADGNLPLHPLLAARWSPAVFDPWHVATAEQVAVMLEAARWAPSAGNSQPWAFLVGLRGDPVHRRLVAHLARSSAAWAPEASILVANLAHRVVEGTDWEYSEFALYDLGQAVAHMTFQAQSLALRGLHPADLLAVELGGSAIVLLTVATATGRLRRTGAGRGLAQGALTPGLSFLLGDLGLARASATSGSLLLGSEMLLTVLLAAVVLRERVDPSSAGALALGLAGTALVSVGVAPSATRGDSVAGNLLVLAAVACGAAFTVWSRHARDDNGEGLSPTTWQFLGAAVAVSPFVLGSLATGGTRLATAEPRVVVAAVVVLCCGLGALFAFNIGIRTVTATRAALLENLQPVAGTATAVALLGESLGVGQALGGGLVVVGLTLLLPRRTPVPATADESQNPRAGPAIRPPTTPSCAPPTGPSDPSEPDEEGPRPCTPTAYPCSVTPRSPPGSSGTRST
ncbi:EamA family transporter [Pseudonocardia sp. RS11V-5]|uniref:EamA family transporter n=1 Tax=Pseudonocardia terrae TaxID=2905831 RepID=UPI001E5C670D|nr:EamA family transporter [Pseudonocardia terrae]MCE3551787.1 EamA family transporter [Pseudonocardia terrae]